MVERPVITAPHSVVAGQNMTVECSVNFTGKPGILRWTNGKRGDSDDRFGEVEAQVDTVTTTNRCLTTVTSTMAVVPEMHQNGTILRCEVIRHGNRSTSHTDSEMLVVPGKNNSGNV